MTSNARETHYLGLFYLAKPQPEHAQLTPAIKSAARDVKVIPLGGKCVMYLLVSETHPHKFPLARIVHTGDQYAWFEIGDYTDTWDFNAVKGWLDSHRPRR